MNDPPTPRASSGGQIESGGEGVAQVGEGLVRRRDEHVAGVGAQAGDDRRVGRVFPQRVVAANRRRVEETVARRRGGHRPFERPRAPGIRPGDPAPAAAPHDVDEEHQHAQAEQDRAERRHEVQLAPAGLGRVGVNAPRHPPQAQLVEGEERQVEPDEEQGEVPQADPLAEHPAGPLGEPVIERPEEGEDRPADQDVMQVGDDEEGIVRLEVDRDRGEHHPGQATDQEGGEEGEHEPQRDFDERTTAPEGGDPAEDLDAVGDRDHQARCREQPLAELRQGRGEHVVDPDAEADERHGRVGQHQRCS